MLPFEEETSDSLPALYMRGICHRLMVCADVTSEEHPSALEYYFSTPALRNRLDATEKASSKSSWFRSHRHSLESRPPVDTAGVC